jgi:hypothetical protein
MRTILVVVTLFLMAAGSASAQGVCPESRICSTLGFSFEPPNGSKWRTGFGTTVIQFYRTLDPFRATMHAGAVEGQTRGTYGSADELVVFVRGMKSQWGSDGRYRNIKELYTVEGEQSNCVRYRLYAEDTGANSRGAYPSLPLLSVGRFCLHPKVRTHAVDLYYSIRHAPDFGVVELEAEGEALLGSLQFTSP